MKSLVTYLAMSIPWIGAFADEGRIYTKMDPAAGGGIDGAASRALTHALAIDHERAHVYRAETMADGKAFHFAHLPTGRYDLVLVSKDGGIFEGLALGPEVSGLSPDSLKNLQTRIAVADSFFNRHVVHRLGIDGDKALAFVERIRDKEILKQSGEKLGANLRRLEVIELAPATDDWQMTTSRHLYREEEALERGLPFLKHHFLPQLGNVRVVDGVKQLGLFVLPLN